MSVDNVFKNHGIKITIKIKSMKHLLPLKMDYILETRFLADQVKDEKTGYFKNDWVDEKKERCNGRQNVEQIVILVEIFDREGYRNSQFQKLWIDKSDVIYLAEKIKELDAVKLIGVPNEDLPF